MADFFAHLKLDFNPFEPDSQSGHFFPGGGRQELLDQLIELCSYHSDLAVVTGPLGAGKSTLLHWLSLSLESEFVPVPVQATLFMSAEQFLESICAELGLSTDADASAGDLLGQLDQYADSLQARSRTLQLLVDDAHELGEEALTCLLDLVQRQADSSQLGEDGIRAVLFGEAMLLDSMEKIVPEALQVLQLEPLDTGETAAYLQFKLECAGFSGRLPLAREALAFINSRARGMPGAINALASEQLESAVAEPQGQPELGFFERHLVAASAVFGAVVLILFFSLGRDAGESSMESGGTPPVAALSPIEQGDSPDRQRVRVPLAVNVSAPSGTASAGLGADPESVESAAARPADSRSARAAPTASDSSTSSDVVATATTGVSSGSPVNRRPGIDTESSGANAVTVTPRNKEPSSTAVKALLSWPADSYTLQLLGSHSESSVRNFIAGQADANQLTYFESRYQERPWYVVVYGEFPDRDAARDAIAKLPPALQELKPWARNLADIQSDIRRFQ